MKGADMAGEVVVVGVGETDYADDWRRCRAGERPDDRYGYAQRAFAQALVDSGVDRRAIDGLVVGQTLGYERMAEVLGMDVRWAAKADAALSVGGAISAAVAALLTRQASCVALVYGNDQRSVRVNYGGRQAAFSDDFLSYSYYAPWGLTSQGALYALTTRRYMEVHGLQPEDLGNVAVAQRQFASLNSNAVMRDPITIPDYLESPYIVEPLRLYDYTMVNDGGVALVLAARDSKVAAECDKRAVVLRGFGRADTNSDSTSLRPRLVDFYRPAMRQAADAVYESAGCQQSDVDLLQIYDSFSCHVILALTGFGFTDDEHVGQLLRSGMLAPGGALPVNTSGGHLSESYMQGWNHQVEMVRQLRGEAGTRQLRSHRIGQYVSTLSGKSISLIYGSST